MSEEILEKPKMKKKKKKGLIISLSVIGALVLTLTPTAILTLYYAGGSYFYNFALSPNATGAEDLGTDDAPTGETEFDRLPEETKAFSKAADAWFDENVKKADNIQTVQASYDNINLKSYFLKNDTVPENHNYAILVHGYRASPRSMSDIGHEYYTKLNYNVLFPANRGHDLTKEANPNVNISMGWLDHYDIIDWAKWIVNYDPQANIILHGVSMGGATVMMVSGEDLSQTHINAIVEDCGYTSVGEQFAYVARTDVKIPTWPILQGLNHYVKKNQGWDIFKDTALKQLSKATVPMFFIHGDADNFVPYYMLKQNIDAYLSANENNKNHFEFLTYKNTGHAMSALTGYNNPEQDYFQNVFNFVTKYNKS